MLAASQFARIKSICVSVIAAAVRASSKLHAHATLEGGVGLGYGRMHASALVAGINGARVAIAAVGVNRACERSQLEIERSAVQLGDGQRQVGVVGPDRQMTRKGHGLVVRTTIVKSRLSGALEAFVAQRLVWLTRALAVAAFAAHAAGNARLALCVKHLASVCIAKRFALPHPTIGHFNALFAHSTVGNALVLLAGLARQAVLV